MNAHLQEESSHTQKKQSTEYNDKHPRIALLTDGETDKVSYT